MKVGYKHSGFNPVTITLETPEELRAMMEILAWEINNRRMDCIELRLAKKLYPAICDLPEGRKI